MYPESETRVNTKSQSLTQTLIEAIVNGDIQPGSKISEPELAKQYQVSRGPLREAIMRLMGLGLIERIPHIGARIISLNVEKLAELYTVREALEGMAARLAATNMLDGEIECLEELLDKHLGHIEDVDGASYFHQYGDFDFHYLVIKGSKNAQLISLFCDELYHLLRMYRYQSPQSESRSVKALNEHKQILFAIRNRDGELAELLMRRHISASQKLITNSL
jgi:DNA-binding GntR family transcriptional regulator